MIIQYLKMLTFLSPEEIEEYEKKNNEHPELREAHQALAREIITDLHGRDEYENALRLSKVLFSGDVSNLTAREIEEVFKGVSQFNIEKDENLLDFLVNHGIVTSKREGRELINSNSISMNGEKVNDCEMIISKDNAIENKYIIVRRGKKKYYLGLYE